MTISTTTSRAEYAGNGVTTIFAFPYPFFADADLTVLLLRASGVVDTLVLNTDYTVSGEGTPSSGQVTLMTAPASGETLFILRELDLTQETDYISGDPFPAESHERALDRLTLIDQQQQEQLDRALILDPTSSTGVSTELPVPTANALIGWNTAADELQNYAGTSDVLVSTAMKPVVTAATLANARSEFGATAVGEAVFTAANALVARNSLGLGVGADIASAATLDLSNGPRVRRVTGAVKTTAFTLDNSGPVLATADGAWPINVSGVLVYTCTPEDSVLLWQDGNGVQHASVLSLQGTTPNLIESRPIVTASTSSNAITITIKAGGWWFHSTTLGTGTPEFVRTTSDLTLTIASTDSFGLTTAFGTQRIAVGVVNDGGTLRAFASALYGGVQLDETNLITTATTATSATAIKCGAVATSKAYRVLGFVDAAFTTAVGWGSPALTQSGGGQPLAALSSLGYGQTWQNLTGSRANGTTYYNTTGRPITVAVQLASSTANANLSLTVGGVLAVQAAQASGVNGSSLVAVVPPGQSYVSDVSTGTPAVNRWAELR